MPQFSPRLKCSIKQNRITKMRQPDAASPAFKYSNFLQDHRLFAVFREFLRRRFDRPRLHCLRIDRVVFKFRLGSIIEFC
jgi:hypothetical protein